MTRWKPFLLAGAAVLSVVVGVAALPGAHAPVEAKSQEDEEAPPERIGLDDWPPAPAARRGQVIYGLYCDGCHGADGRGDGDAASWLNPPPRDFQKGNFKFRSTQSGQLPTVDDLVKTITCGLPGSAMPGFHLVPELQRRDVAEFVLHLALLGRAAIEVDLLIEDEEISMAEVRKTHLEGIRKQMVERHLRARRIVPVPPEPVTDAAGLAKARARYDRECSKCHGLTGRGEGNSAYSLRDWKDSEILPRDFTTGVFRSGSSARDLYLRLRTGLNGTPMPFITGSDEDIWGLVHFILSLKNPDAPPARGVPGCASGEDGR